MWRYTSETFHERKVVFYTAKPVVVITLEYTVTHIAHNVKLKAAAERVVVIEID